MKLQIEIMTTLFMLFVILLVGCHSPTPDADHHVHEHDGTEELMHEIMNSPPYPNLTEKQRKRLLAVQANGNNPNNNPNYFQEVYDAVCEGLDTETAVKTLFENEIYTDVILPDMDSYQAFKYLFNVAGTVKDASSLRHEYAKRVLSEMPKSAQGLETGFILAVGAPLMKDTLRFYQ